MRIAVPDVILPASELGAVHFIGIGGAGLSAIARIMLARGITVSGSDGNDSAMLETLRGLGATINVGHDSSYVAGAETVIASTAVHADNPEIVEAQRRGIRLWPRSAGLASVMADHKVLAVAGTHGKTTTTSMLTVALQAADADPTYAIGGELTTTGTNAAQGQSEWFVAEADESDGAFLVYSPFAAIVTNVDADHLDSWGTEEAYQAAFGDFVSRVAPASEGGFLVACTDDIGAAALRDVATATGREFIGVGTSDDAEIVARDIVLAGSTSTFTVTRGDERLGEIRLQVPGRHYVLDALAALALGLRLGFEFEDLARGLASFGGTRRRMEFKGEALAFGADASESPVRVYDSYAHHPSEIAGDLEAARSLAEGGRVVVAFQPHLVSRTKIFGAEMGRQLSAADEVVVLDIYLAREEADPAVTPALITSAVTLTADRVIAVEGLEEAAIQLVARATPGDLVLTLGAGTITQVGPLVLELLRESRE